MGLPLSVKQVKPSGSSRARRRSSSARRRCRASARLTYKRSGGPAGGSAGIRRSRRSWKTQTGTLPDTPVVDGATSRSATTCVPSATGRTTPAGTPKLSSVSRSYAAPLALTTRWSQLGASHPARRRISRRGSTSKSQWKYASAWPLATVAAVPSRWMTSPSLTCLRTGCWSASATKPNDASARRPSSGVITLPKNPATGRAASPRRTSAPRRGGHRSRTDPYPLADAGRGSPSPDLEPRSRGTDPGALPREPRPARQRRLVAALARSRPSSSRRRSERACRAARSAPTSQVDG